MTRDLALDDPEVRADLALRERTARERKDRRGPDGLDVGQDPDGLSPAIAALYDSVPDPVVEHWPCRGGCGRMVGVTQVGVERLVESNKRLAARRERPIGKHEVMGARTAGASTRPARRLRGVRVSNSSCRRWHRRKVDHDRRP